MVMDTSFSLRIRAGPRVVRLPQKRNARSRRRSRGSRNLSHPTRAVRAPRPRALLDLGKTPGMRTARTKTILITGASSGLGAEMARQFAAKGYDLALCARRLDRLEELRSEITAAQPGRRVEIRTL